MRELRISTLAANAESNAIGALLSNGYLRIYPAPKSLSADDAVLVPHLAELRFAEIAFNDAVDGVIASLPLLPDTNTAGGGEAAWFRAFTESEESVFDGTVGLSGHDINLQKSTAIHPGGELHISSIVYRVRKNS